MVKAHLRLTNPKCIVTQPLQVQDSLFKDSLVVGWFLLKIKMLWG